MQSDLTSFTDSPSSQPRRLTSGHARRKRSPHCACSSSLSHRQSHTTSFFPLPKSDMARAARRVRVSVTPLGLIQVLYWRACAAGADDAPSRADRCSARCRRGLPLALPSPPFPRKIECHPRLALPHERLPPFSPPTERGRPSRPMSQRAGVEAAICARARLLLATTSACNHCASTTDPLHHAAGMVSSREQKHSLVIPTQKPAHSHR